MDEIVKIQGPILVLGASGFIGANILSRLLEFRSDVVGTTTSFPHWRLDDIPEENVFVGDLLVETNLTELLNQTHPRTVLDCIAFGAYSFQTEYKLIYQTNVLFKAKLLEELRRGRITSYVHAGSSSEYGDFLDRAGEGDCLAPNSHYSVSKAGTSGLIHYFGKKLGFPCVNLRMFSVYGPLEDAARLVPNLMRSGALGKYPKLVAPEISHDFLYIDDACDAFFHAAARLGKGIYGESINVGTGTNTTIREIAYLVKKIFSIQGDPLFNSMKGREWDVNRWQANTRKAKDLLQWKVVTDLEKGLKKTKKWFESLKNTERYFLSSKKFGVDTTHSISAIIVCYKDEPAIPIMYRRLVEVFTEINVDYEIIFVNDNSPDNSEAVIQEISRRDRKVIGISHSRNFGSQAAFRSGMEIASKNACVLLDGDLQDPPELIKDFVKKWREGYDVVYGRRVKRDATWFMNFAYKIFYRIFDKFSFLDIPHDAGDFSLIDRKVVRSMLQFPERDLFIRGIRAFAGFKQTGVDYVRPERMFGATTNSFFKNVGWAKKGILSFSNTPLNMLSFAGVILFIFSIIIACYQFIIKLLVPGIAPKGITTVLLAIIFFGSINLFGLSLIGEYIAKIFEEVKRRPHFIRRHIIRDGEIRDLSIE